MTSKKNLRRKLAEERARLTPAPVVIDQRLVTAADEMSRDLNRIIDGLREQVEDLKKQLADRDAALQRPQAESNARLPADA